jgi:hypothetical protein
MAPRDRLRDQPHAGAGAGAALEELLMPYNPTEIALAGDNPQSVSSYVRDFRDATNEQRDAFDLSVMADGAPFVAVGLTEFRGVPAAVFVIVDAACLAHVERGLRLMREADK